MKIQIITAIIGISGILLGAGAHYLFSQQVESTKHFQELRTESYVDFIKATAMINIAQKNQNPAQEFDGRILMTDARAWIAIHGSPEVADFVSDFFRRYGAIISPDASASFVAIVSAMRADIPGGETAIQTADIGQLIVSQDVQSKNRIEE